MTLISLAQMHILVDALYHNSLRAKYEQKSIKELARDIEISANTVEKTRKILVSMQLLVLEGERRWQKCYWNPSRSQPNPRMIQSLYQAYYKDATSKIQVSIKREKRIPSLSMALLAFKKAGYQEIQLRKTNDCKRIEETINLTNYQE